MPNALAKTFVSLQKIAGNFLQHKNATSADSRFITRKCEEAPPFEDTPTRGHELFGASSSAFPLVFSAVVVPVVR
jgi:hypothetical protein